MKLFFARCLTVLLTLAFSLPALPQSQTATGQITPIQIQDPSKGVGSNTQLNTLQVQGNFSFTPSTAINPPANTNLTVANASSGTWGAKGQLTTTCGGFNPNGTVQEACPPVPAHFEAEAAGGCPTGTFLDIGTKSCWSCPTGYQRTVHAVNGFNACSKPDKSVLEHTSSAKFISKKACPAGSFFDSLNGGACWTCPSGYIRSSAIVTEPNACVSGIGANRQETFADVLRDNGCQPGEIHDPRNGGECWVCPTGSVRTVNSIAGDRACHVPAGVAFASANEEGPKMCGSGQVYDHARSTNANVGNRIRTQFNNQVPPALLKTLGTTHGTCWTCPPGSKRRSGAIWSDTACNGNIANMLPAPYEQPGLFRLDGGEDVALAVIKERTTIDTLARAIAVQLKQPADKIVAITWEEIAKTPQTSAVLLAAVYARVNAAAANPQTATPAELRLVKSFAGAIQSHRTYIAQTALDAYNIWSKVQDYHISQIKGANITSAFDLGKPPDFTKIINEAIGLGAGLVLLPSIGFTSILGSPTVYQIIFPYRTAKDAAVAARAVKDATAAAKEAQAAGQVIAERLAAKVAVEVAAESAAKLSVMLAASIGPQIVVAIGIELIQLAVQQMIAVTYAKPKLEAALAQAKATVDVGRMLATGAGASEVDSQWAMSMNSLTPPRALAQFASLATAAVAGQSQGASRFSIVAGDGRCLTPQQSGGAALAACGTIRWASSADGAALQVADSNLCLTASANNSTISLANCTNPRATNQTWQFNSAKGWITSTATQRCVDVNSTGGVAQNVCDARTPSSPTQRWAVRQ